MRCPEDLRGERSPAKHVPTQLRKKYSKCRKQFRLALMTNVLAV